MNNAGDMSKCAERDQDGCHAWHHRTTWDALPPTPKEPHRFLPPCKVRGHVLRSRDLLDYRLWLTRKGPPIWGGFRQPTVLVDPVQKSGVPLRGRCAACYELLRRGSQSFISLPRAGGLGNSG